MTFDLNDAAKNLHDLQKVGEAMGLHGPQPGLGSGALREVLDLRDDIAELRNIADALMTTNAIRAKQIHQCVSRIEALSLSSPIEPAPLTVEEVVACLWTRSDGSPDPAATTSRLNNLLRKRPTSQASSEVRERIHEIGVKYGGDNPATVYLLERAIEDLLLAAPSRQGAGGK